MTEIPQPHDRERLLALSRAFQESRVLLTGAELDLFSLLAPTPLTAAQVAKRAGGHLRPLTVLLDALSSMGLLLKEKGRYQTAPPAAGLLASGSPGSILPMVRHAASMWRTWDRLTEIVRDTGRPAGPASVSRSTDDLHAFIGAMHVIGEAAAGRVVAAVDPGDARALLDVGGGPGTYTMAFLRASPGLRATLFDRPAVVQMAKENLRAAGLLERVTLVAGDYLEDELPAGHDLALLSAVIHSNSPGENLALYRRVHAALRPGGRVIIRDHVMDPDRIHPRAGALFAVNMLVATQGGGTYTFEEIAGGLSGAGFVRVRRLQRGERMDDLVEAFRE